MVDWRPFLFGGLASSVAELGKFYSLEKYYMSNVFCIVTFPIDLTKTRLQIQGQIFDNSSQKLQYAQKKYTNMFQALIGKYFLSKNKLLFCLFIPESVKTKVYESFILGKIIVYSIFV